MGGALESPTTGTNQAYPNVDPFENEQRFLLTRDQVVAFYGAVKNHATLELYDHARPISYTRTTYFDTDDFAYLKSCDGDVARRLRVREYALAANLSDLPTLSGVCFLELKQHAGNARSKVRLSAPAPVLSKVLYQQGAFDPTAEGLPELSALRAIQDELVAGGTVKPRMTTWYRRSCMSAESGRVRITLDENLTFCKPQGLGAPGETVAPTEIVANGPSRVLEIKHWGPTPGWLDSALANLTPATSFSKFRMGMAALQRCGLAPQRSPARTSTPTPNLFVLTGGAS